MIRKCYFALALSLICFFAAVPAADARSYSIDEVQIRAWIQPDGDLMVNEIFTYSFTGKYSRVKRFIHEDHHAGVSHFEAYELVNPDAELGFIKQEELQQLPVSQEDKGYYSSISADNEPKYIFYAYTLTDAVKSYETYSDLTVPFFGTGSNHDQDYANVTIEFVFPEEVEPADYYAFFHDSHGIVEEKGPSVVRFTTPVSEMYTLTEPRLLFSSEVMNVQATTEEPMSLEDALAEEERYMKTAAAKEQRKDELGSLLTALAVIIAAGCLFMLFLPQRRKGTGSPEELLKQDPLRLYALDRLGKKDFYAFLAGLYSLVEKGFATVTLKSAYSRFQKDPEAPDQSLLFTLTADPHQLSDTENKLAEALFKAKGAKRTFLLSDLTGATKKEKEEKIPLFKYLYKIQSFKVKEQQWWKDVIDGMETEGVMRHRIPRLLKILLQVLAFAAVIYAYIQDSRSFTSVYGISGLFLLGMIWNKPAKGWPVFLFWGVTLFAVMMVQDADLLVSLFMFIISCIVLTMITPRMILSRESAIDYRCIKLFRKQMKRGNLPLYDLEKLMIRSQLLRVKSKEKPVKPSVELAAGAPLAYLMLTDQNPVTYMEESWKMTMLNGNGISGSGSSGYYGDSSYSSFSGGDSGGGGGDGGGGAGAD